MTHFNTPYGAAPFSRFAPTDYLPAIQEAIAQSQEELKAIAENTEAATFENTVAALAYVGRSLSRLSAMFFNLNSAETNTTLQAEAQRISPLLTEHQNDIFLNEKLFARVKQVYTAQEHLSLLPEQQTLLEKTYKAFVRNGANLTEVEKEHLRTIDKELSTLKLKFSENVLAETKAYRYLVNDPARLSGLPESEIAAAKKVATQQGEEGWAFTLDFPVYTAVMKYADDRQMRETLFTAYHSRCVGASAHNNEDNVLQIVRLRKERAQLLGYDSYATMVLEERMAESTDKVMTFLNDLLEKVLPKAQKELKTLQDFAQLPEFRQWDFAYYAEKLKQQQYQIDDQLLKPYLSLDQAVQGMFAVAQKLYGLHFTAIDTVEKYHPEVQTYEVTDASGTYVALLYTDFFPRAGKRNGAWMTSYKEQYHTLEGKDSRPHISIVCNFSRPTDTAPSLLTFGELTTLFHEFGHALHGMLSRVTYPNLSGTNVARDFVELPSQLMENWCYEEETLRLFANHYQTGEPLPIEWVQRIQQASAFMEGILFVRQLNFGFLDMAWHTLQELPNSVSDFEREATKRTQLYPPISPFCFSTSFSHIFSGGYAAGYYSYKWSEVLDADAFVVFKEAGIFNPEVAARFCQEILSKGSSEKESLLYERFRGQAPSVTALLNRVGI